MLCFFISNIGPFCFYYSLVYLVHVVLLGCGHDRGWETSFPGPEVRPRSNVGEISGRRVYDAKVCVACGRV